jgi:hypothetical protein
MARNKEVGLDYFPFDINFFQDIKIRKLIKYQSGKAITVYALLLCLIYKSGYYVRWDEELAFIISEQTGFEESYILEVIKCCMALGLLSKELYDKEKILTSKGIQKQYNFICRQAKRKSRVEEFSIIVPDEETVIPSEEIAINSEEMPINSEVITQSKVKESKENIIIPPTPPKGFEDLEKAISEKDHALNEALARIKELEEKIAKDNPAKPKRANSLNANARKAFEEHFRNTFGEEYYWTAKDAGNMSQLLRKLTFSREQRQMPVDDASVLYALQVFLTSVKDSWLLDNFSVANINSKYNEIVSKAKNGNSGKGTIGSTTTGSTEKFVCSKAEKGADRESDRAPQKDYSSRF